MYSLQKDEQKQQRHNNNDRATTPYTFSRATQPHEEHPERNEDNILIDRQRGLVAIFDGVGSTAGEIASRLAAQSIRQGWKRYYQQKASAQAPNESYCEPDELATTLRQLIEKAHQYVKTEGTKQAQASGNPGTPGTTLALVAFCQQQDVTSIVYAHVGDSRIYLLRPHERLHRLTEDDGYLSIVLAMREITPEDALRIDQTTESSQLTEEERNYFDKRNGITQALGDSQSLDIHIGQHDLLPGDKIVLCTDGIHDNLTDVEIEHILTHSGSTTAAKRLVEKATWRSQEEHMRAKKDDMSAVVVSYGS